MPVNIEIKARLRDPLSTRARAEALADGPPRLLRQEDVFFCAPYGRLKLRIFPQGTGELIHYERADALGPKESHYTIAPVECAAPLRAALDAALGVRCIVRKSRTLFFVGQTRIHLDDVENLGAFLELEVVLRADQDADDGRRVAEELFARLAIPPADLVAEAYADLLADAASGAGSV